jgi:hypothetical protein
VGVSSTYGGTFTSPVDKRDKDRLRKKWAELQSLADQLNKKQKKVRKEDEVREIKKALNLYWKS